MAVPCVGLIAWALALDGRDCKNEIKTGGKHIVDVPRQQGRETWSSIDGD